jgi:hypothetical protein
VIPALAEEPREEAAAPVALAAGGPAAHAHPAEVVRRLRPAELAWPERRAEWI